MLRRAKSRNPGKRRIDILFWICAGWLILLVGSALLAPLLPLGNATDTGKALLDGTQPYLAPFTSGAHPLGTNGDGLDLMARVIYGARDSLTIAVLAVMISLAVGGILGVLAGFYRRGVDSVIGILTNALLAVPPLILLIVLGTIYAPTVRNMALALSLLTMPMMARLARAQTISYNQRGFVLAARSIGASQRRLIVKEIVPSVLPPMLSMAVLMISVLVVAQASLSFLGLGTLPPAATWGNMIAEAQRESTTVSQYPFILMVPGFALFMTVFSFNLVGERAQAKWDPRGAKL